ncbi:MAG: hypothetical protein WKF43_15965 [Acidimicrobiales bacterium]
MATAARMVPVASLSDPFEAKLLAAHLGAEGIVWELRGSVDGVYPLGPFEILVEQDAFETARILLDMVADDEITEDDELGPSRWRRSSQWFAVMVIIAAVLFVAVRMFSFG